jgi:hypothetical protein
MRLRRVDASPTPAETPLHVGKPVVTLLSLSCTRVQVLLWAQRRMQKALSWRTVAAAKGEPAVDLAAPGAMDRPQAL